MPRFSAVILLLLSVLSLKAQNAVKDFDTLSQFSSDELMKSGRAFFEQRVPGKALTCFTIVSGRYQGNGRSKEAEQCIRALNNSGCVYNYFFFDYVEAYGCFIQAYDMCEELDYDDLIPMVLVNLGDLLNKYGVNYNSDAMSQQADSIFDVCINRAFDTRNWELLTTAFFNLADQNFTLDLSKYNRIFSSEIPDTTADIAYIRLQYQGIQHIQSGRFAEARSCFEQQLPVVSARWAADRDTLSTYISIAKTYDLELNFAKAAEYLEKALAMSIANRVDDHSSSICRRLARCYEAMGNQERYQYYRMLCLEKMEANEHSRLSNIGELNYINELHKREEKAQKMAVLQRLQQYAILAAIIILIVVLISTVLLWRTNKQLKARNKSLFEKYQEALKADAEQREDIKYSHSNLNTSQKDALVFRVQQILGNAEAVCQHDFNLSQLAKMADSNTTYVSQVINEYYGKTFSTVLANSRIKEACRRINDEREHYSNITIEGIATSVGFKSRTAFINAFKREVGLTPSEYLRLAAEASDTLTPKV